MLTPPTPITSQLLYAPGDSGLAATNCGFLTLEQCRATVSGIGGFCVPNQFYNPQRSAKGARKRGEVRAFATQYDPYPSAPSTRTVICKTQDSARVAARAFAFCF